MEILFFVNYYYVSSENLSNTFHFSKGDIYLIVGGDMNIDSSLFFCMIKVVYNFKLLTEVTAHQDMVYIRQVLK